MCPEVIFTSDTFQINHFKETTCEVHKKSIAWFFALPQWGDLLCVCIEPLHDEMVNNALNWQCLSFIKTVPEGKGLSQSGAGCPEMVAGTAMKAEDPRGTGKPLSHALLAAYANHLMIKLLQLCANICQCINVIPAMLHMCPTNRGKPKPHETWFMPSTGWTCWQI